MLAEARVVEQRVEPAVAAREHLGDRGVARTFPVIIPPQVAIIGFGRVAESPVVVDGDIVVRPMMYVALTYDHRLVDGREAVTFLKTIKQTIEQPERLLLKV